MATKTPLVFSDGVIERLQPGDTIDRSNMSDTCNCTHNCDTYNYSAPTVQRTYIGNRAKKGTPVFFSSGNAVESSASRDGVPIVSGFIVGTANYGEPVDVQVDGIVVATEVEWASVVTENTALQENVTYYLSDIRGQITSVAPPMQGSVALPVGLGLSSTELVIRIGQPVKL